MTWVAGAVFVNPPAGTVLVDTGPLAPGAYRVEVAITANPPGWEFVLEWRDAPNASTMRQKILPVTLAMLDWNPPGVFVLGTDERLRVVARADAAAEVEASLFYQFMVPSGVHL